MRTRIALPLLLASALLAGCITTNVTPLTGKTYPPIDPEEVILYLDERDIPGGYEKIATIYARGDYAVTDEAQMFRSVRKKAAKLGANGVLLKAVTEPGTGEKVAHHILGTGADRRGELVAIYVRPAGGASESD